MDIAQVVVKVLGTAQDGGAPQANCQCENCKRSCENPMLRRFASSLAVVVPDKKKWHLLDATPDMREQLRLLNRDFPGLGLMSSILLTHAHIGHYTGLMFLGKEALSTSNLPVYAGEEMGELLATHVPWKPLVDLNNIAIRHLYPNKSFILDGQAKVLPFEVPHRNEFSKTFGMMISGKQKQLLYIPDIDSWDLWKTDLRKMVAQADYCLLDGTFFSENEMVQIGRDFKQIPHPLMTTTMELLKDVESNHQTKVYFTHMNHTNPAMDPNSKATAEIRKKGFYIATEGMTFAL